MAIRVDDRDAAGRSVGHIGPGAIGCNGNLPWTVANSNGRNHRERRAVNDGNSAVSYIGHVDFFPAGRNSDGSWIVPHGNVRDQSLGGSVDDRNGSAVVIADKKAVASGRERKPTRACRCRNIAHHQIG